jgi:hypothetical protein
MMAEFQNETALENTPFPALENNVFKHRKHRFLPKKTQENDILSVALQYA